jgi:hypothetical protein
LLPSPLFLTQLFPPGHGPTVGQRVHWPGDDRAWVWTGAEWVAELDAFDGGDLWEAEEERGAA